jgi:hypothetical protein
MADRVTDLEPGDRVKILRQDWMEVLDLRPDQEGLVPRTSLADTVCEVAEITRSKMVLLQLPEGHPWLTRASHIYLAPENVEKIDA